MISFTHWEAAAFSQHTSTGASWSSRGSAMEQRDALKFCFKSIKNALKSKNCWKRHMVLIVWVAI